MKKFQISFEEVFGIVKFISPLLRKLREAEWRIYKKRKYARLNKQDFTIIASNCIGSTIYHDMGLRYTTPTVNLAINMPDFVKMCGNLKWYMEQDLVELIEVGSSWPVGLLGDIRINFVHYTTFEEGAQKWIERRKRINWDRIVLIGVEKDGCDNRVLHEFDRLPWPNKVILTHVEHPEFTSAHCIKGFKKEPELGMVLAFKRQLLKRRYLDDFDYVSFLNSATTTAIE